LLTNTIDPASHFNRATPIKSIHSLTVRHLGSLVPVFVVLAKYGLNVEEMENVLLEGREASIARIQVRGNVANIQDIISEEILALGENKVLDVAFLS